MTKSQNSEAPEEEIFKGSFPLKLDSAQRVTIPTDFKQVMERRFSSTATEVVLLPGDGKVKVLPIPQWHKFQAKLATLPSFGKRANKIRGLIFGNMVECKLDAQSRIRLSRSLCELAGLTTDVFVVGQGDEMHIWDAKRWHQFNVETARDLDDLMDGLD